MLLIITTTLFLSLIFNIFLKRIHLPPIIGYIFTGTIITYLFGLHEAVNNHQLKEVAEFGVVFLMFTIGLEISIDELKEMRYEVFVIGTLQIVLTSLIVFAISYYLLGIDEKSSIVISMALSLSSTAIVLKTLNENGGITKPYGRNSLGILIMQDIAVIPILLIIWFLSSSDEVETWKVIAQMVLGGVFVVAILWLFGKYLLEPFLTAIVKTESDELFISAILFLTIGASYLAHLFDFSYSLGAFIAGMLIADTKYRHQVESDLVPFRDLLLGVFFVTVGMQIDIWIMLKNIHLIFAVLLSLFLVKFSIIYGITRIRDTNRTAFKSGLALIQIGEFSLAVLELSNKSNLLPNEYTQILIVSIVLSMVLTPMILMNISNIADRFVGEEKTHHIGDNGKDTIFYAERAEDGNMDSANSVVVLGYGDFGQNISKRLKESNIPYTIIENNLAKYQEGLNRDEPIIFGNGGQTNILKRVIKDRNQKVIIAIDNPKKLRQACEAVKRVVDSENIIVRVHSQMDKEILHDLDITNILVENNLVSQEIVNIYKH